ncbi:MAG: collagen-like protein [Paenisporosarcina sp.]
MSYPTDVNDTVVYNGTDLYVPKDSSVTVFEDSRIFLFGEFYLNGQPILTGGSFPSGNEVAVGPIEPVDAGIILWFDTTDGSYGELKVKVAGSWKSIEDPSDFTALDEVYVGTTDPYETNYEIWVDTTANTIKAKVGGSWVDFPGPTGETGAKGDKGDRGDPGIVQSIIAGANVVVNNTNPAFPIISSTGGGEGGGGISDGDMGEITVSGSGTNWVIDNNVITSAKIADNAVGTTEIADNSVITAKIPNKAVTYAKIQDVTATDKLLGRVTAGAGVIEEVTCTSAARSLLDDSSTTVMRSTLGAAASTVSISTTAPLTGGGDLTANRTIGIVLEQTIENVAGATYTVVAGDVYKLKKLQVGCTVTLPNATIPTGSRVDFVTADAGSNFVLGSGAVWDIPPTPSPNMRAIGSVVSAIKMSATGWILTGDLI